jgi:6-phosphofructokinase 1
MTSNLFGQQRVTSTRNKVKITDRMWARLLSSTNQPSFLSEEEINEAREADRLANRPPVPAGTSEHTKKHSTSLFANGEK